MTLSVRSRPRMPGAVGFLSRARFRSASRLRRRIAATWRELARGRSLPAAVSAGLAFERGERVLSTGSYRDGQCGLVATDRALYYRLPPRGASADGWSRLGWERIARVGWDAEAGQLVIIGLAGAARPRTVVPLRRRGTVPELALERVTHTKLGQWHLLTGGIRCAVIEARRKPVTGELVWFVTSDPAGHGSGSGDRGVAARIELAIARLRADFAATPQPGGGLSLSLTPASPAEGHPAEAAITSRAAARTSSAVRPS